MHTKLADFLVTFQANGLQDPETGTYIPHSYGNAFYALVCASRFLATKKPDWLMRASRAIEHELAIAKHYRAQKGVYRWEFKNYALAHTYELLRNALDPTIAKQLESYIRSWKNIWSYQTNYTMMRAVNDACRSYILAKPAYLRSAKRELARVLTRQDVDGLWWDDVGEYSFQYHAYILALLAQYLKYDPSPATQRAFIRGIDAIIPFTDPSGDFNYLGRGSRQVFGYVSLTYALRVAAHLTGNIAYDRLAALVQSFALPTLERQRIVVTTDPLPHTGWYPYNCISDYLAFSAWYLDLAAHVPRPTAMARELYIPMAKYYSGPGIVVVRGEKFLACIGGTSMNHAAIPFVYHTYPLISATSGGPAHLLDKTPSQTDFSSAFVGFLKNGKNVLHRANLPMTGSREGATITYDDADMTVRTTFAFTDRAHMTTTIVPKGSRSESRRIRITPFHGVLATPPLLTIPFKTLPDKIHTLDGFFPAYESPETTLDKTIAYSWTFGPSTLRINIPLFTHTPHRHVSQRVEKIAFFMCTFLRVAFTDPFHAFALLRYARIRTKYYSRHDARNH